MFENLRASRAHNKRLKAALAEVQAATTAARSDDDLVAAIRSLTPFGMPVAYDPRFARGVALLVAAPLALAGAVLAWLGQTEFAISAGVLVALTGIVWLITRAGGASSLNSLADKIHYQSTLFDYGLTQEQFNPEAKARQLGARFRAFRLGNHSREMRSILRGHYGGSDHAFDYQLYHFHYVNRRVETYTTTDAKGNVRVRTRTVYDHFDRYGLIVPFAYARDITISESMLGFISSNWKTASQSFNRKFSVQAASNMAAAKFLVPKVIVEIEAAGAALSGMEIEINGMDELCLSFSDANTILINRAHGLDDPESFATEISGHAEQPRLIAALGFLHTLMKYTDNNFDGADRTGRPSERTT